MATIIGYTLGVCFLALVLAGTCFAVAWLSLLTLEILEAIKGKSS